MDMGRAPAVDSLEARAMRGRLLRSLADGEDAPARLGRFEIGRLLGEGSFGSVFEAYDPKLDRTVAIKVLHRGAVANDAQDERLVHEARIVAALNHPNIVAVYTAGRHEGRAYVVMERISGGSLADWAATRARSVAEIVEVFQQVAAGLAAAHRAGVMHRDVKLSNIMVGTDGRVCVTDFGLASASSLTSQSALDVATGRVQMSRRVVGTPAYMAPEVLAGQAPDARCDQFAFCVALFVTVFAATPFGDELPAQALLRGARLIKPASPRVPARLWHVLVRGLSRDPQERFASMDAVRSAFAPRRRTPFGVLALGSLSCVAAVLAMGASEPASCDQRVQALVGHSWSDARRESAASVLPPNAIASVDAYMASWADAAVRHCEADRSRANARSDRVSLCLEERSSTIAALADEWARGDEHVHIHATRAIATLDPIETCAVRSRVARSTSSAHDAEARAIRQALSVADARMRTGRANEAMDALHGLEDRARTLGRSDLEVVAGMYLGRVLEALGRYEDAAAVLQDAFFKAEGIGEDALAAQIAVRLIVVLGTRSMQPQEALHWSRTARAALTRLEPPDERLHLAWLRMSAMTLFVAGRYAEARPLLEEAVAHGLEHLGEDDVMVAGARANLGLLLLRLDEPAEALAHFEPALQTMTHIHGPVHPDVADMLLNRGAAHLDTNAIDAAIADQTSALEQHVELSGPSHPSVAAVHHDLGNALMDAKRYEEAVEHLRLAEAIWSRVLGPDHPDVAMAAGSLGRGLAELGEYDRANEQLDRAIMIYERAHGREHPILIYPLLGAASVSIARDDYDRAARLARRALELTEATLESDHSVWTFAESILGEALLRRGDVEAALPRLERALVQVERTDPSNTVRRARLQYLTGRAQLEAGRDRSSAFALLAVAKADLESEDDVDELRQEIDDLLATNPPLRRSSFARQ
jgi:eukaryotic-like serine/threonine-protein kinase